MPIVCTSSRAQQQARQLPAAWEPLRPHSVQNALWNSHKRFCAVAAGRGSGKTVIAKRKIIKSLRKENGLFFYALPTYNQAKRVVWRELKALVPPAWIKKVSETELYIETIFGSILYVVGMDKPERVEGLQYDGGILDEASDQRPGVFEATVRPALTHKSGWMWLIGAIKLTGIGASSFQDFCFSASEIWTSEGPQYYPDKDPEIAYYNWPSWDILPSTEIESAKRQLDKLTFQAQMGATWQNVRGGIFYAFSDQNISTEAVYNPQWPILVGSDFNVDPMSWVIGHFEKGRLYIFDEIFLRDTNTHATLNELYRRYGTHQKGFYFLGDATSRSRKSSAVTTDYLAIKNDTRFYNSQVIYDKSNPPVADRFSSTNSALKNAAGEIRTLINPICTELIKDLKRRAYKPGTREPNDTGDIGHITDAFGYVAYKLFPPVLSMGDAGNIIQMR